MSNIGVGAFIGNKRPTTKKALMEAIRDTPEKVTFEETSMFERMGINNLADLMEHPEHVLTVTGPDPYHSRKFTGTIFVRDGRVMVQ